MRRLLCITLTIIFVVFISNSVKANNIENIQPELVGNIPQVPGEIYRFATNDSICYVLNTDISCVRR